MSDRLPTDPGQPVDSRRLSVRQAAIELDTTPDAIRARIRRGTLYGEKVGSEWIVVLTSHGQLFASGQSRQSPGQSATDPHPNGDSRGQTSDSRATGALLAHLTDEITYLRDLVRERDRALEERSRELATERERSDVLQQLALSRIPAVGAGDTFSVAQDGQEATDGPMTRDDLIETMSEALVTPPMPPAVSREWAGLTDQLVAELGMDPEAALIAAAAELGIAYGD